MILNEKGVPIKLIHRVFKGHDANLLQGKRNAAMGVAIRNNKGVFQGVPISAVLYITIADGVMGEYENELLQVETENIYICVKTLKLRSVWGTIS